MTTTLKLMISCEPLNLLQPFDGACFGHAMNKIAQYATNDNKISKDLALISVKSTQSSFQSCIIWPKYVDNLNLLQFK
jgi:hypothetical protein